MAVAVAPSVTSPRPRYSGPVTTAIEWIGPVEAEWLLARNDHNRKLKEVAIGKMQRDILAGDFALNGESIKVSANGRLLDGQNRCTAVFRSGVGIWAVIVRGLPEIAQETVDIGEKRKLADVLTLRGEVNTHVLAAAIMVAWRLETTGNVWRGAMLKNPSSEELLAYFGENEGIRSSLPVGMRLSHSHLRYPPSAAVGLHYQMSQRDDPAKADEFWDLLDIGSGLNVGDPILTLRSYLVRDLMATRRMDQAARVAITIKCWNAWRAGKVLHVIKWVRSGKNTEEFPTIRTPHHRQSG